MQDLEVKTGGGLINEALQYFVDEACWEMSELTTE